MSSQVAACATKTSAFTYLEHASAAPAEEAAGFTRASEQSAQNGWEEIIDQLIDIGCLQDDWDGAGSAAPDRGICTGATKLALTLKAQDYPPAGRVTPSVNGTICFEWHTTDGYQEVEITSPLDAELCWVPSGSSNAQAGVIAIA